MDQANTAEGCVKYSRFKSTDTLKDLMFVSIWVNLNVKIVFCFVFTEFTTFLASSLAS